MRPTLPSPSRRPRSATAARPTPARRRGDAAADRERLRQIEIVLAGFLAPRHGRGSQARRADIILAAIRIVARDGIRACTISALAKETGFARGHFTYHFRSKDEILGLAFATVGSDYAQAQAQATQGTTARERIEHRVRGAAAWALDRPEYFRCLMHFRVEMMRSPSAFRPAGRVRGMLFDAGAALVREAVAEAGLPPRPDPDVDARVVFATIDGMLMHAAIDRDFLTPEALGDAVWSVARERLRLPG